MKGLFSCRCRISLFLVMLLTLGLVVSACGGQEQAASGSNTGSEAAGNSSGGSSEQGSSDQDSSSRTDQSGEMPQVTLGLGIDALSFAPLIIATENDYFKEEGVDVQVVMIDEGAGTASQALVGDSVQFIAVFSGSVAQAYDKGADFIAIQANVNRLTMDMVLANESLEKVGIDRSAPIEERFKALDGLTIGNTGPGSALDLFTRYYMSQAGLTDEDTRIVAVGGAPSLLASLEQGQIDGFMLSPPIPQMAVTNGTGEIFIAASQGDVPDLANFPYEIIGTRRSYAKENPEIVKAVATAIARGNNLILDHPDEAMTVLQEHFNQVDPAIFKPSFDAVAATISRDGAMNEAGWQTAVRIFKDSGRISKDIDAGEGILWTNEYLSEVNGRSK